MQLEIFRGTQSEGASRYRTGGIQQQGHRKHRKQSLAHIKYKLNCYNVLKICMATQKDTRHGDKSSDETKLSCFYAIITLSVPVSDITTLWCCKSTKGMAHKHHILYHVWT